jgi:hypothetical protein
MSGLRNLPSVEQLLQSPSVQSWIGEYGRPLTLEALRHTLDEVREGYREIKDIPSQRMPFSSFGLLHLCSQ